jgi:hypothetical protein
MTRHSFITHRRSHKTNDGVVVDGIADDRRTIWSIDR